MDVAYDVAISFLSPDEPIATKLHADLSESLRVFVYSKRQEELAGTDGLESFRQTFLTGSKLVVVLYRDGWGQTRWTAVEELAIKDRLFSGGWELLLFVMLDEKSTPPAWLPNTHIRLSYTHYREALVGAIKMRAQELGSTLKVESALEKAKRVQANELLHAEREQLLINRGTDAARKEHAKLRQLLDEKSTELQSELTTIKLEHGCNARDYIIRSDQVSLLFYLHITVPATESHIVLREFDGALALPGSSRMYFPGEGPREIAKQEFYFDYNHTCGWCWRQGSSTGAILDTPGLAEHLMKSILELHQLYKTGARTRYRETSRSRSGGSHGWMG